MYSLIKKEEIFIKGKNDLLNGFIAGLQMKLNPFKVSIQISGKILKKYNFRSKVLPMIKTEIGIKRFYDSQKRITILDFLLNKFNKRLFSIGRLDYFTMGTIIVNNDSSTCTKLSPKKFNRKNKCIVKIKSLINNKKLFNWRHGINLSNKFKPLCSITFIKKNLECKVLKIIFSEARYAQIRRNSSLLGYKLLDLKKVIFGIISLGNHKGSDSKLLDKYVFKD